MKINIVKFWGVLVTFIVLMVSGIASGFYDSNTSLKCNCQKIEKNNSDCDLYANCLTMMPILIDSFTPDNSDLNIVMVDTPDEFSWKNLDGEDYTTPAKSQGNCGSCGIFSAIGALESIIKIREDNANLNPDLSEQYVLSCLPDAALIPGNGCNGGMGYMAYKLMMETTPEGNNVNGALFESFFPYRASDDIPCSNKMEGWEEKLVPILDCGQVTLGFDSLENREIIKSMILEKGPIAGYMYVPMSPNVFHDWGFANHDQTDYYPYEEMNLKVLNHEIMMLGWKDDPSIGNGGYWICKNSWGTNWGYDGFFNIEYGALFTGYIIDWVDYEQNSFDWPIDPHPPSIPSINGPINIKILTKYEYKIRSTDQDNDKVFYTINWGDRQVQEWIGPFNSDEEITLEHLWWIWGTYYIKIKAIDIWGAESDWATLKVSMPRTRAWSKFLDFFPILQRMLEMIK